MGVFHSKGWWPKTSCISALESLSSLGFEERNLGCPGNFAGMSQKTGGVQRVCAKKVRAHFSFPKNVGCKSAENPQKLAKKGGFRFIVKVQRI